MPKSYIHRSLEERALIQVWLEHDLSLWAIALKLRQAPSTINREFSRSPSLPAFGLQIQRQAQDGLGQHDAEPGT